MEKVKCGWCGALKDISEFRKRSNGNPRNECAECSRDSAKKRYQKNKEQIIYRNKLYYLNNKQSKQQYDKKRYYDNIDANKIKCKRRYDDNKEEIKSKRKAYYNKNRDRHIQVVNKYLNENKSAVRQRQRINHHKRKLCDLQYKLKRNLRARILQAIKSNLKSANTCNLIGCSIYCLKKHLESKFQNGMSWLNHGVHGWHIDHIIPCSSFDLSKPEEQFKCFHYSNLQPLWSIDNLKKGNKIQNNN